MNWPAHGSNPQYLYEAAGLEQPGEVIDFSANINPFGPPPKFQEQWGDLFRGIEKYPDPQTTLLKKKLAGRERIEETEILIGNGGAEIISLIGRLLTGKHVMIVEPAFSEYEQACKVNNCEISYFQLSQDWKVEIELLAKKLGSVDALFFCNPNNPTGLYFNKQTIQKLLTLCKEHNCYLIVDEAFYDFVPEYDSLVPYLKSYPHFILLRSMTKMYAIPGLRLGYVMARAEIIARLSNYQPHWSVNSISMKVGEYCLEEEEYVQQTVRFIGSERERLFEFYRKNQFEVSNSKVNFYLLRDPSLDDQYLLFKYLLEKGIVPRHTFNFPGLKGRWLRFAVRTSGENQLLMEAMLEWRRIHRSFS